MFLLRDQRWNMHKYSMIRILDITENKIQTF